MRKMMRGFIEKKGKAGESGVGVWRKVTTEVAIGTDAWLRNLV